MFPVSLSEFYTVGRQDVSLVGNKLYFTCQDGLLSISLIVILSSVITLYKTKQIASESVQMLLFLLLRKEKAPGWKWNMKMRTRRWNMREARQLNEKELLLQWTSIIYEREDAIYKLPQRSTFEIYDNF